MSLAIPTTPALRAQGPTTLSPTISRPDDALADDLNEALARAPGQTFMPPALLAQEVLAQILPEARVENLVVVPLPALDGDPEQVLP